MGEENHDWRIHAFQDWLPWPADSKGAIPQYLLAAGVGKSEVAPAVLNWEGRAEFPVDQGGDVE